MSIAFVAMLMYKELKKDLKEIKAATGFQPEHHETRWQDREASRRHDREEHRAR